MNLCMTKLAARWVLRLLTDSMKKVRADCCKELLHLYNANPNEFLFRVITGDETWLYHWDPETKQASIQWQHVESPPPQEGSYSSVGRESHGHNLLGC